MNYNREPNWEKLKPTIDWDEQEEKLANKLENYINQNKQTVMNQGTVKSQKFTQILTQKPFCRFKGEKNVLITKHHQWTIK